MNYLAHIYLSGENEKLVVGNFIGDYVKGKSYLGFPENIQKGILLHRQIDTFTDNHPNFRKAKQFFIDEFGLYSGIVIDFFYDYFLALNWQLYSDVSLRTFSKKAHAILLSNYYHLPKKVQRFLPFLIQNRRLESYATVDGIQKSLEIMSRYTSLPEKSEKAVKILNANFHFLEDNFTVFMREIIDFVENEFNVEIKRPRLITGL